MLVFTDYIVSVFLTYKMTEIDMTGSDPLQLVTSLAQSQFLEQ